MQKKIGIIYTGGTIGMMETEQGYAPDPQAFPHMLEKIHDVNLPGFPAYEVLCLPRLLDSSDVTYQQWNEIGCVIASRYQDFDGFVVLHGTDTMAYTASAMSFMLEGLDKAVVFTGSQIPLCRFRSDGIDNLVTAVLVAASGQVHEVCLYFGGALMRGNRVTKMSADDLDAFSSPNYPRLAEVGTELLYRKKFLRMPDAGSVLNLCQIGAVPIAVIKIFPGITSGIFQALADSGVRGIVLEAFGAGNIPGDQALADFFRAAKERQIVVAVCSQCAKGSVALGTYAASRSLTESDAISLFDMTTEAAVAKLYYLFSKYTDPKTVRRLMLCDLRGEITLPGEM